MKRLSRRHVLVAGAAWPLAAVPRAARAAASPPPAPRALSFTHLHTGERLDLTYFSGDYLPSALDAVNHLLRDFRTGEVGNMDPRLLDVLHALTERTGSREPFQVISGYRSVATNEALRQHSSGVASGSLHMKGQAIDIRLGDVRLEHLRDAALSLRQGGVGYYSASQFVHVDTGRVRTW